MKRWILADLDASRGEISD